MGCFCFSWVRGGKGFFDRCRGLSLPNAFSEVTGHPGNGPLSHAASLLVIGGNGICGIDRVDVSTLAESSGEPKACDDRGGAGCLGLGVLFGGVVYMAREGVC